MSILKLTLVLGVAALAHCAILNNNTAVAPPLPAGWNAAGCDNSYRSLWTLTTTNDEMTLEICLNACKDDGSTVAGVSYTSCFCNGPVNRNPADEGLCDAPCPGNPSEICGDKYQLKPRQIVGSNITDSYFYYIAPVDPGNSTTISTSTAYSTNTTTNIATTTTDTGSTSTIYSTDVITITSCAATVTDCPLRYHTTLTTSTPISQVVYQTSLITITSCAATVTDCPLRSHSISTIWVPLTTVVCPATTTTPCACDTITIVGPTTVPCPTNTISLQSVTAVVTTISGTPHYVVPSSAAITVTVNTAVKSANNAVVTTAPAKGNVSAPAAPTKSAIQASGAVLRDVVGVWGMVIAIMGMGIGFVFL